MLRDAVKTDRKLRRVCHRSRQDWSLYAGRVPARRHPFIFRHCLIARRDHGGDDFSAEHSRRQ